MKNRIEILFLLILLAFNYETRFIIKRMNPLIMKILIKIQPLDQNREYAGIHNIAHQQTG